jgi:thermolysin
VGPGRGVWDDLKKMSVDRTGGSFRASDRLRPANIQTYDLQFDFGLLLAFDFFGSLDPSNVAEDVDNDWTDGGVVDAHAYAGLTYDYYARRHGRRGIDDFNGRIIAVTHGLHGYDNAFWNGFAMFFGEGDEVTTSNNASGLDVVAHEYTHGVTDYSWNGIYLRESGALNEAFSDIMGAAVEFFFEPPGDGRKRADYWIAEDLSFAFNPRVFAIRSMENPSTFCRTFAGEGLVCDPDHYSRRYLGSRDNGGVHINSGIANQAFYLLIEGGTNRTSGIRVGGIGAASRERAERIFYRGFTAYLTPSATFADARAATIRAAQDLYGAGSREAQETALAWTAVGVQ